MGFRSAIRNLCTLFAKALAKPRNFLVSLIVRHHRGRTPRPSTGRVCDEADGTNNAGDPTPGRRERGDPHRLPLGTHRGGGAPRGGAPRAHSLAGPGTSTQGHAPKPRPNLTTIKETPEATATMPAFEVIGGPYPRFGSWSGRLQRLWAWATPWRCTRGFEIAPGTRASREGRMPSRRGEPESCFQARTGSICCGTQDYRMV